MIEFLTNVVLAVAAGSALVMAGVGAWLGSLAVVAAVRNYLRRSSR